MDECSPVHAPSCREIGSVARLAGIAQSLSNAVEGGREPGADRPWRGVAVTLALQQRHLEQRERFHVRVPKPDRRLEHGIVAHQVVALPDAKQRGDGPAELVLQVVEEREVAAELPQDRSEERRVGKECVSAWSLYPEQKMSRARWRFMLSWFSGISTSIQAPILVTS